MLKNWSFLHMSCMVIGRKLFEKVRFEATLKLAAEDVLFFCDCVLASKRVVLAMQRARCAAKGSTFFIRSITTRRSS